MDSDGPASKAFAGSGIVSSMTRNNAFNGVVLALDLATTTGWARGKPGEAPTCGALRFGKPGTEHCKIFRAYRDWLDAVITPDVQRVVYESSMVPMIMQGRTRIETVRLLVGMAMICEELCCDRVELREASVSDVRSFFIGSNMKREKAKPLVMERCHALGWDCEDDNAADAAALWSYQVSFMRPDLAHTFSPLFTRRAPPSPSTDRARGG
jgi:hypothetical protein